MVLSVFGGRFVAELPKNAVEVGKTGKAAFQSNIGDFFRSVEQKELTVTDPYPLDILGKGISCNSLELVGQVIRAHVRFPG